MKSISKSHGNNNIMYSNVITGKYERLRGTSDENTNMSRPNAVDKIYASCNFYTQRTVKIILSVITCALSSIVYLKFELYLSEQPITVMYVRVHIMFVPMRYRVLYICLPWVLPVRRTLSFMPTQSTK